MIKGKNIDKEVLRAGNRTVFDLSGSAAYEMVLLTTDKSITINTIYVYFEEASSADAGCAINIGATTTGTDYFTATSSSSKSAGDVVTYDGGDMTLQTVPKETPIYINHAGSKTGDGTVYVWFSYTING